MASLTDVYQRRIGAVASRRRVLAGLALFAVGLSLVAVGVLLATTGIGSALGLGVYGAREWAGILAGVGLPATFVGLFAILPTSRLTRATIAIGASLTVFAVALFTYAYPTQWPGAPAADPALSLMTLAVYFVGAITTGWCLFVAIATFKTRKSPGGAAEMRITEEGTVKLVEAAETGVSGVGGIGLFGTDPDGEVPTQTGNRSDSFSATRQAASDGGSTTVESSADGSSVESAPTRGQPDRYCGNCEQFNYVRTDDGLEPYCSHHGRYLEDMDACEEWASNSDDRLV
ncbi:hypothetical protein HLRTI_000151 [Halorhabdus tiamatea SARL4B]|uniref:Conserved hypothetical membrane protein n=1 Tax=Halorhabdus tiamatea SARL4B TaxID=1033806 RepID=F7PN67_9EURY|nr:hypothetical protein [Halorhabdus tiamatea]ERJ07772.1 hypothetical protein HLRTI_000151 [Halorhabdus tiamatea SARL4B]CCQ32569.1 conserved hypothetical membrane protein [Halorhabdus tiamatea SARL4B]